MSDHDDRYASQTKLAAETIELTRQAMGTKNHDKLTDEQLDELERTCSKVIDAEGHLADPEFLSAITELRELRKLKEEIETQLAQKDERIRELVGKYCLRASCDRDIKQIAENVIAEQVAADRLLAVPDAKGEGK